MELGLKGRNIVVTASSKGLGLAVAEKLAEEGARLLLCSRQAAAIRNTAERLSDRYGIEAYGVQADVSSPTDITALIDFAARRFGSVDGLVCNTGGPPGGSFLSLDDATWEQAFQSIVMSVVRLIRGFYPLMRENGGRILAVASSSVKVPIPGLILSNVFRAGLSGLMKTLASELADSRILANTICPGRIATDRLEELDRAKAEREGRSVEQLRQELHEDIPLGRFGRPEEFADLAAFLLSERNSYLTGSVYLVDGGLVKSL